MCKLYLKWWKLIWSFTTWVSKWLLSKWLCIGTAIYLGKEKCFETAVQPVHLLHYLSQVFVWFFAWLPIFLILFLLILCNALVNSSCAYAPFPPTSLGLSFVSKINSWGQGHLSCEMLCGSGVHDWSNSQLILLMTVSFNSQFFASMFWFWFG